ncbi:MAG: pyruvate ferredoxin oxidoreductase, partial [bacterium]
PIVMANVNRAIAPPWNLWSEQTDSLAQRDTGWIQFYCESNQDVFDTVLQAFRISERVLVPSMLVLDAFILSHTTEGVDVPEQSEVDAFLPPYRPEFSLDPENPGAFGGITDPAPYFELKRLQHEGMMSALRVAEEVDEEFGRRFGRRHGIVQPYRCDDAELVLVVSSTTCSTARIAVDMLRDAGHAVGALKIRLFRPFPAEAVYECISAAPKVAVVDRNLSIGTGGIFAQELRAALYGREPAPAVFGFVTGLGGGDITPEAVRDMALHALKNKSPEEGPIFWKT